MRRGDPKLVELEHLPSWEIPWFSRSARPEGSLSTGREWSVYALHRAWWHTETGHYWAPISTDTHCKSLHGHKMNYCLTWLNLWHHHIWPMAHSAKSLYQRIKRKQRNLFPPPFFPFQPCRVKISRAITLYGNYYHSPRRASKTKCRDLQILQTFCGANLKLCRNSKTVAKV